MVRLGDLIGRKRMLLAGTAVFTIGVAVLLIALTVLRGLPPRPVTAEQRTPLAAR
ncbi:hypothetical protein ACGFYY_17570 [Streptomyces sp. NPDC048331]|uniref:hypothetical protein n=1 Tax=Streptomyces sp. NPDC048331 TaxID=3365534 RepID=UPI00371E3B6E